MTRALETYGTCAGCGVDRLTPGLALDGGRLCTDCAGGLGDFFCEQCGQEARRYRRGICGRCVLTERLHELLDDGTGSVRAELLPLFDALRQMKRPWGGLTWTGHPHVQYNLRALARGEVPLTHDGLSQLTPWRSVAYLRDLLIETGILPPADRQLLLFQRWLAEKLTAIGDTDHRRLLELFAAWHVQRRLTRLIMMVLRDHRRTIMIIFGRSWQESQPPASADGCADRSPRANGTGVRPIASGYGRRSRARTP
jgi:hypothetical protein